MSGILDSKARVIDAMITNEGRRQIAQGDLRVEYVSFTDAGTYYTADVSSGSADASAKIFLEACNLPQDAVTFESDDTGRLRPFNNQDGIQVKDGQIIEYSFAALTSSLVTGSLENVQFLKGDDFAGAVDDLLASSLNNFKNLQLIATHDRIFEDDGFGLGNSAIEFVINKSRPLWNTAKFGANLNQLESIFNDVRLSNIRNFKYLPPINRIDDTSVDKSNYYQTSSKLLGYYKPWGRMKQLTYNEIKFELFFYEKLGYSRTINIDPTSRDNWLVGQFFEKNDNQLRKLDVIDYGKVKTGNALAPLAHIFFVGKLMVDDNQTHTFIHLFTLVFE